MGRRDREARRVHLALHGGRSAAAAGAVPVHRVAADVRATLRARRRERRHPRRRPQVRLRLPRAVGREPLLPGLLQGDALADHAQRDRRVLADGARDDR
eukprot:3034030-Prymnesium_polylepis.1